MARINVVSLRPRPNAYTRDEAGAVENEGEAEGGTDGDVGAVGQTRRRYDVLGTRQSLNGPLKTCQLSSNIQHAAADPIRRRQSPGDIEAVGDQAR